MKPPRFLGDLYADLRDRRLLPLVIVLALAIPAIPLFLSDEAVPTPPPPVTSTSAEEADLPNVPAVLASNPGLRDYRERLDSLSEKNPFGQEFKVPKADREAVEDLAAIGESSGSADSGGVPSSSSGEGTDPTSGTPAEVEVDVDEGSSGSGEIREFLIRHELRLEIDGPDRDREFEGVRELDTLPGKKTPLIVYVGVTPDQNEAVFLLSGDIVKSDGDGDCRPARDDCQVLSLAAGDQRKLFYAPDNASPDEYVLKLHEIERVVERIR